MVGKEVVQERPVFIPPRKRTMRKGNGNQNYVDHIVPVQGSTTINLSNELSECIETGAKFIHNRMHPNASCESIREVISPTEEQFKMNTIPKTKTDLLADETEENEMQNFESISERSKDYLRDSATVTPSSYSESSFDGKSSKSQDCLTSRSKKRVNIRTDLLHQKHDTYSPTISNYENLESGETSILNADIDENSLERYNTRRSGDSYFTMTGTIKRGRKKGQSVDLQLNISREELEKINAVVLATEEVNTKNLCCICNLTTGVHIFMLSVICLPFVTLITSIYSFYMFTLTWNNMFNYFNEEKSCWYKLFMSPVLILAYPIGIILCTLGLGVYAGFVQLSLRLNSWMNEISDVEKGFYGWLCGVLRLSDCSPYEVVILTDFREPPEPAVAIHSSMEELSL